jgi:hypothetical protein
MADISRTEFIAELIQLYPKHEDVIRKYQTEGDVFILLFYLRTNSPQEKERDVVQDLVSSMDRNSIKLNDYRNADCVLEP